MQTVKFQYVYMFEHKRDRKATLLRLPLQIVFPVLTFPWPNYL
jgi:hypothetical protein